jgi:hypothetical protein
MTDKITEFKNLVLAEFRKAVANMPPPRPEWQQDLINPPGFMADILQASRQRSDSASLIPQ